jgi:hypothetical protein
MAHPYARKNSSTTKKDIRWSAAEKELMARESLRLMHENNSLSRVDALRKAVLMLPAGQRKEIKDMAHSQWVIPLWEAIAEERDRINAHVAETPMPQESATAESAPVAETEVETQIVTDAPVTDAPTPKKHRGMAKGAKLVRWNDAERRTIAKGFLKLQNDFPDLAKSECVRRSMQYNLPDNRQRKFAGYATEKPWLEPLLVEVANEVVLEREAQERHRNEVAAEQTAQLNHVHEREELEKTAIELADLAAYEARTEALSEFRERVTIEELLGLIARKLVKAIARPLVDALREEISGSVESLVPAARPTLKSVSAPPRDRKPLVGVFGLVHQQDKQLERDYAGRIEFVFGGDQDGSGPKGGYGRVEKCDMVLLMGEYVSHEVRNRLKSAHIKFEPLLGSMSAARVALDKWLGEGQRAA